MKIKINKNKKLNATMSKKNKKILKQINEGTIISIQNMDITLEEFLSKDENTITKGIIYSIEKNVPSTNP